MSALGQANRDARGRRTRDCAGRCGKRTEAQSGRCRSCTMRSASYDPRDALTGGQWVYRQGIARWYPYGQTA